MVMNTLAAGMEIPKSDLDHLRGHCVRDAKSTNGSVSLKDAVDDQSGGACDTPRHGGDGAPT